MEILYPDVDSVKEAVTRECGRVAALGGWPAGIPAEALLERLPEPGQIASGFDAGVACCLDLIPRERQRLSAQLHAAYSDEALEQVRAEAVAMDPDSETCWWLAACSVCDEDNVSEMRLLEQLAEFARLAEEPEARREAARRCHEQMLATFELQDGVPFGVEDGCMHGAYLAGYPLATMRAEQPGEPPIYYIGTYRESLGLEEFRWSSALDRNGRPRSGPVHGSRQYVKASDEQELARALSVARAYLGV